MAAEVAPAETLHMRMPASIQPKAQPSRDTIIKNKTKIKVDPLKALEPSRKKISAVEAQRVMAVLTDSIQKLELLSILPQVIDNVERFSIAVGAEILELCNEHRVLRETYEEAARTVSVATGNNPMVDDDEPTEYGEDFYTRRRSKQSSASIKSERRDTSSAEEISVGKLDSYMRMQRLLRDQLTTSTKNIMRAFSRNPTALTTVLKECSQRSRHAKNLLGNLNELKEVIVEKLLTSPLEAQEQVQYLLQVTQRERSNALIIDKLERELNADIADKEEEIKKKNDVIRRLQADLHQIVKFSDDHVRRTKSEADKQEAADMKNSDGKKSKLQMELTQLKTQLQNLMSEHHEKEQNLRSKKYKIETEVENWIMKYDQDMGDRQDEYERKDAIYTEEKKQLHELEERFKTLEEEYIKIMEERRIAQEKREQAERELQVMIGAATIIQSFWRSFKVRKVLKGKKKKGGKGKGKGKGKKKKK